MIDKPKIGDKVICIDDDSDDEDFGMSGIVFKGRNDLIRNKEYIISSLPPDFDRNIPNNNRNTWTKEEYPIIKWKWYRVHLEGVKKSVFLLNFKPST